MSFISPKLLFFVLVIIAAFLEVVGDVFFKKWSNGQGISLLIWGMLIYGLGTLFWVISLKYELLSKAISIFTVLNLISIVLIGVIFFQEDLSLINKLGILLGVVSVILLEV